MADPDVRDFLRAWGLEEYIEEFQRQSIDVGALAVLNEEHLKLLVSSIGHRAKLSANINEWKNILKCVNASPLSSSNASQVVLDQVGFNLSGNISCEVTTEIQFSTITVFRKLTVIELPKSGPLIATEKERYEVGDTLRANCTTAPSRPPAQIDFYINNLPVKGGDTTTRDAGGGLWTARRVLDHKLDPSQFRGLPIVVKCAATVGKNSRTAQLSVGSRTAEPVPERVTSPSQSWRLQPCYLVILLLFPLLTR